MKKQPHKCIHEVDFALLIREVKENTIAQRDVLERLNGNGRSGIVERLADVRSSVKRAWWMIGIIVSMFAGLCVKEFFL